MISISKAEHLATLVLKQRPGGTGIWPIHMGMKRFQRKRAHYFEKNEKTFRFILALSWNQHFSEFVVLDILSRQRRYR